tara:strand:+ start:7877 stop:8044 length:168 start_codon:yes stop_codon:yes gene_type:complete
MKSMLSKNEKAFFTEDHYSVGVFAAVVFTQKCCLAEEVATANDVKGIIDENLCTI